MLLLLAVACGGDGADEAGRPLGAEGAHEHAVARVDIALETDGGTIEFTAPAMGIYGFEHTPRTDAERERQADGERTLRTRIEEMLVFDPALGCTIAAVALAGVDAHHDDAQPDHVHGSAGHDRDQPGYVPDPAHRDTAGAHAHGDEHAHGDDAHREVHAEFRLACERSPVGARLRIEVGRIFTAFDDIDLRVLTPERQIGRRVSATGVTVTL
jgi:hypothetical protein